MDGWIPFHQISHRQAFHPSSIADRTVANSKSRKPAGISANNSTADWLATTRHPQSSLPPIVYLSTHIQSCHILIGLTSYSAKIRQLFPNEKNAPPPKEVDQVDWLFIMTTTFIPLS